MMTGMTVIARVRGALVSYSHLGGEGERRKLASSPPHWHDETFRAPARENGRASWN